ncbi:MAG TPA: hypothetical protein VFX19_12480 [Dehalococcoidia bacterium]|nr:hypothetical protein [Dehalococcoidia bacterium]
MKSITAVDTTHLHLLLNHVPTVGTVAALALLLLAIVRRDEALKLVGLEVIFVIAMLTMPVYMTGVAAEHKIRKMPGVSETAMSIHQDAALAGFTVAEFAGFVAWIGLWQSRRRGGAAPWVVPAVVGLTAASLALMGRAANLGGDIRHPEIASAAAAAVGSIDPAQFVAARISYTMVNSSWVWPASETVHFFGLSLSMGVLLAINLRILGAMKRVPFGELHRLLPWGMLGFGANLITGMLFFIGQPGQYLDSAPFYWKVVFLMVAGANFLYLTVFRRAWAADAFHPGFGDKAMAVLSIFSWLAVLYGGRMLPFIGHAF